MLLKQDYINFWKNTAEDSWQTAEYLMNGKKYVDALFMFCLSIEKLMKANWVLDNIDNYPPRIYDCIVCVMKPI